jgi:hypothetical protein
VPYAINEIDLLPIKKKKKKKRLLRDLCVFSIRVLSELFLINGCSSVLEECIRV